MDDYITNRKKELRNAAGLDPKDSRVTGCTLVFNFNVNDGQHAHRIFTCMHL